MSLSDSQMRLKAKLLLECITSGLFDDHEQGILYELGDKIFIDPDWSGYLFWPQKYGLDGSIEAAIEKAFSYKPIILGPSDKTNGS